MKFYFGLAVSEYLIVNRTPLFAKTSINGVFILYTPK